MMRSRLRNTSPALVRFREREGRDGGHNIQEKWFKICYLRIAWSQRIGSLLQKTVIFSPYLIGTLSFSVKLLYRDGSIYIIHTMEILC